MISILMALVAGVIFSLGLMISGMANPAKVQNFLDVAGQWDPSLAFVMIGAIGVGAVAFRIAGKRSKPLVADTFSLPTRTDIDKPLLAGAAIFGIGWGLAGYCPGPAIASISIGATTTFFFVISMLAGMILAKFTKRLL